jgi:hypothetical protein
MNCQEAIGCIKGATLSVLLIIAVMFAGIVLSFFHQTASPELLKMCYGIIMFAFTTGTVAILPDEQGAPDEH